MITPHESYRESLIEGTRAQFSADLGSANAQAGSSFGLQHARNGVHYWAGGGTRRTDDYATPEGTVENSATESASVRAGVGWSRDRLFASAGVTSNGGRYGVPFAGEFHGHHGPDEGESGGHGTNMARRRSHSTGSGAPGGSTSVSRASTTASSRERGSA